MVSYSFFIIEWHPALITIAIIGHLHRNRPTRKNNKSVSFYCNFMKLAGLEENVSSFFGSFNYQYYSCIFLLSVYGRESTYAQSQSACAYACTYDRGGCFHAHVKMLSGSVMLRLFQAKLEENSQFLPMTGICIQQNAKKKKKHWRSVNEIIRKRGFEHNTIQ